MPPLRRCIALLARTGWSCLHHGDLVIRATMLTALVACPCSFFGTFLCLALPHAPCLSLQHQKQGCAWNRDVEEQLSTWTWWLLQVFTEK